MNEGALLEVFRHNAWANTRVINFCGGLTDDQLEASLPGVYGSISATLQHYLGAEAYYRSLFAGALPAWSRPDDDPATLSELSLWASDMALYWEGLLSRPFDEGAPVLQEGRGGVYEIQGGLMLAQTIHHSNVHREQICAIVTSLGLEAPDVSGWRFGKETGRIVPGRALA